MRRTLVMAADPTIKQVMRKRPLTGNHASREGMFHFPDRAFDSGPVVLAILLAQPHFASSLGHGHLGGSKSQAEGGALFPRLSRTALLEIKGTGLAA